MFQLHDDSDHQYKSDLIDFISVYVPSIWNISIMYYSVTVKLLTVIMYSIMKQSYFLKLSSMILTFVTLSLSASEVYYVKPTSPANTQCPGDPCQNFSYYVQNMPSESHTGAITMILLEGHHIMQKYHFVTENIEVLCIIGSGTQRDKVTLDRLNTAISTFSTRFVLKNFTAISSSIFTSTSEYATKHITISNCIFTESVIILTNINLTIIDSDFLNSSSTANSLYSSTVKFIGKVRFTGNKGYQGGALMLVGTVMKVAKNAKLYFRGNQADDTGGAIYVVSPEMVINIHGYRSPCFYQLMDYDNGTESDYHLQFVNNSANKGGDHIYGASLKSDCYATLGCACLYSCQVVNTYFLFHPGHNSSFSAVSADATHVCGCNDNGQPQCHEIYYGIQVYPGGLFSLPAVVVGGDYGTTTGTINAHFFPVENSNRSAPRLGSDGQQHQVITKSSECAKLTFSIYSKESFEIMYLTTKQNTDTGTIMNNYYEPSGNDTENYISTRSRKTPVFINITLLPCPRGFQLLGDPPGCECHPVLIANGVKCMINNLNGYHTWNSTDVWVQGRDSNTILFSTHCPFDYCNSSGRQINLTSTPDAQCGFNRAGILCGSCEVNYSLAIGSSHCIQCLNNNNLALLIFFAAAGVLLVFAIAALNLTVTQGTINSLVFYANIIWAYHNILFPPGYGKELIAHKTFIAWLNLDFGIETCFISGMNAYLKTWLQFIFPSYTASLFFIGIRYSSRMSKFFGDRSVPTLATICFLSYSKLLRTIIACLQLSTYSIYFNSEKGSSTTIVWAMDGNLSYGQYPHIFLLLAAVSAFMLVWVPYTFLIFSMQWLRRVDHYGPLKLIARYKPFYDAYFAPLKDKHQYWFGVLLIVQGLLLIVSSLTLNTFPALGILLLLAISTILLCCMTSIQVYKRLSVSLLESSFLINFIMLAVGYLYFRNNARGRMVLLSLSITIAFLEFCGIVVWNLIPRKMKRFKLKTARMEEREVYILEQHEDRENEPYVFYNDHFTDQENKNEPVNNGIVL